ncbi:hypothetical protein PESP_a1534 [Pseudoalteromonas espejiana DSM 9414]|uniref:Uncharacterized protein n=1 Tax=Pseudoalteromonas espejiana TaxID=28107 RepID=A0A510XSL5_9GAMM|nr:hypothetical protein [Pseudoalteromonas espejiana]ASM49638.1 hypothetical protein PESP_a1534 [Pseudoalteromonas espejiana DSM 9414]GEK53567.1 hypothetical protein PES01_04120 [Pseudoalteromonas espejiana]
MKKFYIGAALVSVVMFLLWFINKNEVKTLKPPAALVVKNESDLQSPDKNTVITINVPKQKQSKPKPIKKFDQNLANAAEHVAMQYQSALKFPPYSQPLSPLDEDRLKPNQFYPVSSPIGESGNALTVSLAQYRFVYPEDITLNITAQNLGKVSVELANTDTKAEISSKISSANNDAASVTFKGDESYPRNLQLFVEANVAGKTIPVVAQIQYMPPSATLIDFDNAYPLNDNMITTAHLKVAKSGMYRVRANLYSDTTPLAHLVAKKKLTKGSQTLDLKAHWSVLPEGVTNMRLSDFVIERMSPSPGELNSFGNTEITEFEITDFAYDSLQQLPYQANEQERMSLEFLKGLANEGG